MTGDDATATAPAPAIAPTAAAGAATMTAVVLHEEGGPEVLSVEQVPVPEPGPGEVRVRLTHASLNMLDVWIRKGLPSVPKPRVMGADGAGVVDALGPDVAGRAAVGDRVLLDPSVSCGRCEWCVAGDTVLCDDFAVLGEHRAGTHAGYVVVPVENLHAVPAHLSDVEAGALALTWATAWRMIVTRAQARPGEWMLVWGASAGVGTAALAIARALGVRTIATTRDAGKAEALRELGTTEVVVTDSEDVDVAAEVQRITGGRGVEVVFDHLGKVSYKPSINALRKGGRYVTCGATTGPNPGASITRLFWKQITVLGSTMATKREVADMLRLVSLHELRPLVDRTFPLAQAADAHAYLEAAQQVGKVVLEIDG